MPFNLRPAAEDFNIALAVEAFVALGILGGIVAILMGAV